ncbi:MAG: DUF2339 domain-containing protein [Planctomycetaceae bacterium]|nr:DUF2339 domain-containing protein [Planctomycetaceae bacterium]
MGTEEILIVLVVAAAVFFLPVLSLVLALIAWTRSRKIQELSDRVRSLERLLHARGISPRSPTLPVTEAISQLTARRDVAESSVTDAVPLPASADRKAAPSDAALHGTATEEVAVENPLQNANAVSWETFIGQKAFGWLAVVLFIFAATFFLRYAYQNNWIGPVGRVAIAELVGCALVVLGLKYRRQNWLRFSAMLTSAGTVVLYLATYAAFGFYDLLPQTATGFFLTVLVLESMILASLYESAVVALVAVVGGLLTPVLMSSVTDRYQSLFLYLTVLNAAALFVSQRGRLPFTATAVFGGTQLLFWAWYHGNFHPDKRTWALSFSMLIFGMHLLSLLTTNTRTGDNATRLCRQTLSTLTDDLLRTIANAVLGFLAFRTLTLDQLPEWMGVTSLVFATIHAAGTRWILTSGTIVSQRLLTFLAVAIGFVAWTIPVQCSEHWVATGWAVIGLALWWFGLRVSNSGLRQIAAVMGVLAVGRLLSADLPLYIREPFIPVFNSQTLPSLCVAACVLSSVVLSDRFRGLLNRGERPAVGFVAVVGMLLLWLLLSMDCYGWFVSQSLPDGDISLWRWRGQLALSVFWTLFASVILILGFRLRRERLRWLSMVLFGVTVLKLFLIDMANVQQLYRILAFFVLAVVLGLVARGYQRFRQDNQP